MPKEIFGHILHHVRLLLPRRSNITRVLATTIAISTFTFLWRKYTHLSIISEFSGEEIQPSWDKEAEGESEDDLLGLEGFLLLEDADLLCAGDGLNPYPHRTRPRKVYDLFMVGTELDWVDIRLNELAPVVDYFVILESGKTFSNHSKPKYFQENWNHFSGFEEKIIYRVLNDDLLIEKRGSNQDRERYQRNALLTQVFPSLLGRRAPSHGDVLIVSDVDEIPRPDTVKKLRNCDFPERTGITSQPYLYSFQLRGNSDWQHPQATIWQGDKTILPESLRMDRTSYQFSEGGWHCTSCFSTIAEFVNKIESSSHPKSNKPEFRDAEAIVQRVKAGSDLFDRDYTYEWVKTESLDVPEFVWDNSDRFSYLLNRNTSTAEFRDYHPAVDVTNAEGLEVHN